MTAFQRQKRGSELKKRDSIATTIGLMFGYPCIPETFISFGMTRSELCKLRERRMGQFEHTLGQEILLVLERGQNSEKVGRCNARGGHLACKEDTLPERSEGVDVKKFVVLCMSTGSWEVEKNELVM